MEMHVEVKKVENLTLVPYKKVVVVANFKMHVIFIVSKEVVLQTIDEEA